MSRPLTLVTGGTRGIGAGDPGRLERVAPKVPMGRVGEPEEVAAAIVWLMSDACPYATGATLRVAGGR